MTYHLILKPSAERDIERLSASIRRRIIETLAQIQEHPRGPGSIKLSGFPAHRVRVGEWRIVYEIDDRRETVFVTIVAHRREVYRRR